MREIKKSDTAVPSSNTRIIHSYNIICNILFNFGVETSKIRIKFPVREKKIKKIEKNVKFCLTRM